LSKGRKKKRKKRRGLMQGDLGTVGAKKKQKEAQCGVQKRKRG